MTRSPYGPLRMTENLRDQAIRFAQAGLLPHRQDFGRPALFQKFAFAVRYYRRDYRQMMRTRCDNTRT